MENLSMSCENHATWPLILFLFPSHFFSGCGPTQMIHQANFVFSNRWNRMHLLHAMSHHFLPSCVFAIPGLATQYGEIPLKVTYLRKVEKQDCLHLLLIPDYRSTITLTFLQLPQSLQAKLMFKYGMKVHLTGLCVSF